MGSKTSIAWTESTWNPYRGTKGKFFCTRISEGCRHCYSARFNVRLGGPDFAKGKDEIRLDSKSLDQPFRWKKPRMIFVNSMSDTFHEDVPVDYIQSVFDAMFSAPQHTYQVLTKRAKRMAEVLAHIRQPGGGLKWQDCPPKNIWIGVSVEDQKTADERIPFLQKTPATVRWISLEPQLEEVNLCKIKSGPVICWVVQGGESGPYARPFNVAWARSVRDQCKIYKIAYFLKQIGSNPVTFDRDLDLKFLVRMNTDGSMYPPVRYDPRDSKGGDPAEWSEDLRVREFPVVK